MSGLLKNGFRNWKVFDEFDDLKKLVFFALFRETCLGINNPIKASFSFYLMGGLS